VVMETSDRGLLDIERFDLEPDRPLFHGLLGTTQGSDLDGLTTHDKVPYVLRILEPDQLSGRMAASMAEIDNTVSTWPQLGGDIALGAATVAASVRRFGRGDPLRSGRGRVDLDAVLDGLADPPLRAAPETAADLPEPEIPTSPGLAVAHAASLAPSGGNTQPWTFRVDDRAVTISLDPSRTSLMDVQFRGSYVAIGAAVFNARVAASAKGVLGPVELFGDDDPEVVASVHLGDGADPTLSGSYEAVLRRCTNRAEAPRRALTSEQADALTRAVETEGGRLRLFTESSQLDIIAELLSESDRLRNLSPVLHQEMMSELRWPNHDDLARGLDVRTLALDGSDMAKLEVARRSDVMSWLAAWDGGRALGDITRGRVAGSSGVAVLTVDGAAPVDFVHGGMALERMWLTVEELGLGAQPVSPVFLYALDGADLASLVAPEVVARLAGLRDAFRTAIGLDEPEVMVMVMRLTHARRPEIRSRRMALDQQLR
jgi:hypothetical protein